MVWSSISKVVLSADDGKPSVYVVAEEGDKEKLLIGLKGNAWGGREKMNGMFILAIGADEKSFDYDIDKIFNEGKMPEDLFLHATDPRYRWSTTGSLRSPCRGSSCWCLE